MALYSNLNLFFIRLFTIVVPRFLHAPFALCWGGLFYQVLPEKRRHLRRDAPQHAETRSTRKDAARPILAALKAGR